MPYITKERRDYFKSLTDNIEQLNSCTPGDLNYLITTLILAYVKLKGKDYTHLNDVVGALESAKVEFQRRVVAPYEDLKIHNNGDVYRKLKEE